MVRGLEEEIMEMLGHRATELFRRERILWAHGTGVIAVRGSPDRCASCMGDHFQWVSACGLEPDTSNHELSNMFTIILMLVALEVSITAKLLSKEHLVRT